jgi:hypothetical protein
MEKIRLPFLGAGLFQLAREAGAMRDEGGWFFPPHATIPEIIRAKLDGARTDKNRQKVTENVTSAVSVEAEPPVAWDPDLLEIIAGMPVDEHRSRVIADFYQARIRSIKGTPVDPLAWARRARDGSCHYARALALEALA